MPHKLKQYEDVVLDTQIEELCYYLNNLILISPDGTKHKIQVANDGTLSTTPA